MKCKIAENTCGYKVEKNLKHNYMYAIKLTILFLIIFLFVIINIDTTGLIMVSLLILIPLYVAEGAICRAINVIRYHS